MKDDVDRRGEQRKIGGDDGTQTALDAIAIVGFAEGLGDSKADTRAGGVGAAIRRARREEVCHLLGELLAAASIGMLVVGVLSQAVWGGHG